MGTLGTIRAGKNRRIYKYNEDKIVALGTHRFEEREERVANWYNKIIPA